jgi:hypothetical protein
MGWGRTLLLGDIGTQLNVDEVQRDLQEVKDFLRSQHSDHDTQEVRLRALQNEVHDLKVYFVTLTRLLAARNILTPDDLNKFVNVVDPSNA